MSGLKPTIAHKAHPPAVRFILHKQPPPTFRPTTRPFGEYSCVQCRSTYDIYREANRKSEVEMERDKAFTMCSDLSKHIVSAPRGLMGRPVGRRRHRHQTVNKALDIGSHIINDARNMKPISSLSLYLLISSALYKCGMVFPIRTCNIYIFTF